MRLSFRSIGLAALVASAFAVPAFAQQPQSALSTYPTCDKDKPVTAADSEAAHGLYIAGKRSFEEGQYDEALPLFKNAYKRDCTKHELLNIIARSYELKGDRAEAVNALETYLKRGKPNDSDADAIQKHIAALKQQMAQQATSATAPSAQPSTTAPPPSATTTATAPPPAPSDERHHTIAPWIVVGAGAAMAVTGVVLVVVGLNKISESRDLCQTGPSGSSTDRICPATPGFTSDQNRQRATDLQSQGNTLGAVGGVVGGVGVVAVAGGLVWHFVEPTGPSNAGFDVRPDVRPGYAGATIGARF